MACTWWLFASIHVYSVDSVYAFSGTPSLFFLLLFILYLLPSHLHAFEGRLSQHSSCNLSHICAIQPSLCLLFSSCLLCMCGSMAVVVLEQGGRHAVPLLPHPFFFVFRVCSLLRCWTYSKYIYIENKSITPDGFTRSYVYIYIQ